MRYLILAAGIFAGDLGLKEHMEKTGAQKGETPVCGGKLLLRLSHNRGAFLNLGEKKSAVVRALSVGLTVVVFVLLCGTLAQKGNGLLKTGLSLLLGGAFSNTYDRLHRKYVVDYFSFRTGIAALDRVVFNLADFAIMAGALCVALGA